MNNRAIGTVGENTAAELLMLKGYRIIKRNYRCPMGEIDIIAGRGGSVCFAEVKTRQSDRYGRPCEAVDGRKQSHMRKAAQCYLREAESKGFVPLDITFDVIEVSLEHIENAF